MKNANTAKVVTVPASSGWTFTPTSATLMGHTYDARFGLAKSGDVFAQLVIDGIAVRLHVGHDCPHYEAALKAAATKPAAQPAKQAAKPAAQPAAFCFVEDEAIQRLRLVITDPTPAQRDAIAEAGFFWSNVTKSFHKRLTPKARKAAAALTDTLIALTK